MSVSESLFPSSTSAATPNGTCSRCGGITYENLVHHCTSNVAPEALARVTFPQGVNPGPWGFPQVAGRCPCCGSASLFVAVGGHITCSVIGCGNPTLVDDWLHEGRPS